MKDKITFNLIVLHLVAWLVFIGLMNFTSQVHNPNYHFDLVNTIFIYAQAACIFYGSNYMFFKWLPGRQYAKLAVSEGLFILIVFGFLIFCSYVLEPLLNGYSIKRPALNSLIWFLISTVFWLYILLSVLSLGYYFACRTLIHQSERNKAEQSKQKAEKERLEAEHAFLRAQINPHFLYNTLNFFYAKSLGCAPELSEGILILNDIMRYSLESGEDENGLVLLRNEVEHMQNVIRIHQLRFNNRLQVNLQVNGELNSIRIVPLVLITLVENAFKHGELMDDQYPVNFELTIQPGRYRRLTFISSNKKKKGPVEAYSGIGLANIRRRLAAAYGQRCVLQVTNKDEFYTVNLSIDNV